MASFKKKMFAWIDANVLRDLSRYKIQGEEKSCSLYQLGFTYT
jgi:hypothetical protein